MKKSVKNAISLILALVMVLGAIPVSPAVNAGSPPANFIMDYAIDGDYVDVTLTFKDCAGLYSLDLLVNYDNTVLNCVSTKLSYDVKTEYNNEYEYMDNVAYKNGQAKVVFFFSSIELYHDEIEFCTVRFKLIDDFTETEITLASDSNTAVTSQPLVITAPSACTHTDLNKDYLCDKCSEITLGNNTDIVLENSVIFSKDKKTLVAYLGKETAYTVPSSVEKIADSAFYGAATLKSISADGVKEIGEKAFENCTSLQSFSIPTSITKIEYAAFAGCTSLSSVTVPSEVKSIGSYAFGGCTSLESVKIPDSVTSIGSLAFINCKNLKSATLSNNIPEISIQLFDNCSSLEAITIPEKVELINSFAFRNCTKLASVAFNNNLERIAEYAFECCSELLSANIPSSVKIIDVGAFLSCSKLKDVTFNEGLQYLDVAAFCDCISIEAISIPKSVEYISHEVFSYCTSLKTINLPDTLKDLETSSFIGTAHYNDDSNWVNGDYYISNHLVMHKNEKISGTHEIREGTKLILDGVYSGQNEMTAVTIPDGTTKIGMYSFSGTGISEITIPSSVTKLEYQAFANCSSLAEVKLPDSVVRLDYVVFYNTPIYKNAEYWDNGVLYIGNALVDVVKGFAAENNEYYEGATAPDGKYTIKNGTKYVATQSFMATDFDEVIIPESVEVIDYNTFSSGSLKKLTFLNPDTEILSQKVYTGSGHYYIEKAISTNIEIHGYKGSTAEAYALEYGNKFVEIKETEEEPTTKPTPEPTTKPTPETTTKPTPETTTKPEDITPPKIEYTPTDSFKKTDDTSVMTNSGAKIEDVLKNVNEGARIIDEKGNVVQKDAVIRSGLKIQLTDKSGAVVDEITVVVPGDVESDGKVNAKDARMALRASVELESLNDWQTSAANADKENSKITAKDARFILRASVELEDFGTWLKNY